MNKEITVYSKPDCIRCEFVKQYLKDKDVQFTEINVFESSEALTMLLDAGYSQMPVVEIEGQEPHTGFRPDILSKLAVE